MDIFEYVSVLTSIIIGFGLTVLLRGLGHLIQHPDRARPDWIHLLWVADLFLGVSHWWWFQFRLGGVEWTTGIYLFVLLYAVVTYLRCAVLFPTDIEGYEGYWDYFVSRRRWFFSLGLAVIGIDLVDTLVKGFEYFQSLGLEYVLAMGLQAALFVVAMISPRRRVHALLVVAQVAYGVSWVIRDVGGG